MRLWLSGQSRVSPVHLRRELASTGSHLRLKAALRETVGSASIGLGPPGRRSLWLAARSSPEHLPTEVRLRRKRAGSLCTRSDEDGSLVRTLSSLRAGPCGRQAGAVRCIFGGGLLPPGTHLGTVCSAPAAAKDNRGQGPPEKRTDPSGSGRFPGPASQPEPKGTFGYLEARAGHRRRRATGVQESHDRQGLWFRPSRRLSWFGLDCPAGAPRSVLAVLLGFAHPCVGSEPFGGMIYRTDRSVCVLRVARQDGGRT